MNPQPPAVRSLTEVFILMRNNAIQSKHVFSDPMRHENYVGMGEEKYSHVPLQDDFDVETGGGAGDDSGSGGRGHLSRIPPEWVNMVDEVQYEISRIRSKIKELKSIQSKHLLRPSFDDDNTEEEQSIRISSEQVTSMLSHCQRLVQHIQKSSDREDVRIRDGRSTNGSDILLQNVSRSLFSILQSLTADFRTVQTGYLNRLQTREDNYQQYFDASYSGGVGGSGFDEFSGGSNSSGFGSLTGVHGAADLNGHITAGGVIPPPGGNSHDQPVTMAQLTACEDSRALVEQREREIMQVSKSILELNSMFKDLASIVMEQGTVVDRIDYNCEQASVRVKSALTSVRKAESYQKKNRKMMVIVVLAAIITFLIVVKILWRLV